ncbi:MAG: GT4 family glycosyltransferase PelF [Bacillus sp. (in: Bacteria)]|nr:GT4 family glycosyltransferase PelF [Bacillus sp. (in: firmicutes)]
MRICLISEGAYPRITGGVSSWIQTIIEKMPEHEFIVFSISPKEKSQSEIKYKMPPNLIQLREIFLDAHLIKEPKHGIRYKITESEKKALLSLISSKETDWDTLFQLFVSSRIDSVMNFLGSKDFYDVVYELCSTQFAHVPFTDMFWALRSMVLPLFICIDQKMPEADLYHSVSTGYAGVLGSLAKFQYNKPLILTEHGIYTREREEEIIKATWIKGYFKDIWIDYFYNLSNCAYEHADDISTLFERNREIQVEIGCPIEKTSIIPNGINITRFNPQLRVRKQGIHIGAIVRLVPIKDIKTMLQSFAIVNQEITDVHFYIIGPNEEDEEYFNECLQTAQNLNITHLHFTGEANVLEYLKFLDILVLSSLSEGQPLVILEGLAMGIPYVSTDVGGCKELIEGTTDSIGSAGYIVPAMHFNLLAEKIVVLAKDESLRNKMGENGMKRVNQLYQEDMMLRRYEQLYQKKRGSEEDGGNRISVKGTV